MTQPCPPVPAPASTAVPTVVPPRRAARLLGVLSALVCLVAGLSLLPATSAQAAPPKFYVTIPGTCDGGNVVNYRGVDFRGGIERKVRYPASVPGVCGDVPYQQSVDIGVVNARGVLEQAHRDNPFAQIVLVGYSQGAEVASLLMEQIADGRTYVPPYRVEAKLYADPMQPGTGLGAVFPKGVGVPVINFISPGPGRGSYNGIRFIRYCIETDGVCDNRSPFESLGGYFAQHQCYFPRFGWTVADGAYTNGNWFLARQNCRPPYPA